MMHAMRQQREPSPPIAQRSIWPRVQPKLMVGAPGDRLETEADRAADAVVDGAPVRIGPASAGTVRRQPPAAPPPAGGYSEGLQKLGEAFLKTQVGKQLVEAAERLGSDFIATLPGKIITGTAAAAAVAELAREHRALPAQPPAIPLDFVTPGLKAQLRVEGPIDHPSAASISFSVPLGGPTAPPSAAGPAGGSAAYRAETERMRAELEKWRPRTADDQAMDAYTQQRLQQATERLIPGLRPRPAAATPPEKKEEEGAVRRKSLSGGDGGSFAAPAAVEGVLAAGGEKLPQDVESRMSARFGRDFSGVRVHSDEPAAMSATAIGARAYTFGEHIVFGRGQYAPARRDGQWLLAHELAHVAQHSRLPAKTRPTKAVPLSTTAPQISRKCCDACEGDGEEEEAPVLRAKRLDPPGPSGEHEAPDIVHEVLQSPGRPLDPAVRDFFESRFHHNFSGVRVHTDGPASASAKAVGARAYTVGSKIAFGSGEWSPGTDAGRRLIAHELAHVAQANGTGTRLLRQPAGPVSAPDPQQQQQQQQQQEEWSRLEVYAAGMDEAAGKLGAAHLTFRGVENRNNVFIGLNPKFLKVYDQNGRSLGRIALKEVKGLQFNPGVYLTMPTLVALTFSTRGRIDIERAGPSVIGQRPFTADEKAAIAEEAKRAEAEGRQPKPPPSTMLNIADMVSEPDRLRALVGSVPNAFIIYFVPVYVPPPAGAKRLYASPIEARDDAQPANAPPWPVSVDGPPLAPIHSDPTYSARVDWSAHGNYSVASQAISQIGETIHYKWELFDITEHATKELARDPAATKADIATKPEKTLKERVEEFKASKAGTGTDVTGMGGANREFSREFEDWWKDTKRAAKGTASPSGDTIGEQLSRDAANRLALELAPVSLLVTAVGAALRWAADLFAGPRQQQPIPLEANGIFLVRVIATPGINEDREGNKIIRPPSVDAKVVEVTSIDRAVKESLDEPGAQLAELQSQIDLAEKAGETAKADYLRSLLAEAKLRFEGSPLALLSQKRDQKQKDLTEFRKKYPTLSDYSLAREVATLDAQIALYEHHQRQLAPGGGTLQRVNATLISEVTAEQYPLLISAGPMSMENGQYRWMISDVTNPDGDAYIGLGKAPSAAFYSALTKFGGQAAYGRGRIGVRTAGLGLEEGARPEYFVDSAPTDWALAQKRIDDLVTTLAALGLIVASAGTASAVIGAGVAAARLIQRWQAGKLYLDAQTVSDVLGLLGGLGAVGQLAAGLRVQRFEKAFAIVQEGRATETQIAAAAEALKGAQQLAKGVELANEAIGYGGLLWGNLAFIDQMMSIGEQESSGALTHAAARRARAGAISSAVQNGGLFIAGNVLRARQAAARERAASTAKTAGEIATGGARAPTSVPARAATGELPGAPAPSAQEGVTSDTLSALRTLRAARRTPGKTDLEQQVRAERAIRAAPAESLVSEARRAIARVQTAKQAGQEITPQDLNAAEDALAVLRERVRLAPDPELQKRVAQLETEYGDAVHKDVYANVVAEPGGAEGGRAALIPGAKAMTPREAYDFVIAKRGFEQAVPGHQIEQVAGRIKALEGAGEDPGIIAGIKRQIADGKVPENERAQKEAELKAAEKELKDLKAAFAISVPRGPGGPAGRGYNTYAVVQVIGKDGRLIAWGEGRYSGAGPHAEQIAIDQIRSRLGGRDASGARIEVVGDKVVCPDVCTPDLQRLASDIRASSVTGYVFQRAKVSGTGLASEKTTARTATQRSMAEKLAGPDEDVPLVQSAPKAIYP
jgi:hypothetical protein